MNKKSFLEKIDRKNGNGYGIFDRHFLDHKAAQKAAKDAKSLKTWSLASALATIVAAIATVVSLFV